MVMEIAPALQEEYDLLNEDQRAIVSHEQGPLLVIAGPGSGKTHSLTLLAMNLFLCKKVEPSQLVLCTYTEKAARELHDRITSLADKVDYKGDVSQMRVGTIHSICERLLNEHLHRTRFGNDYELLDQFTQRLLIFKNLEKLCDTEALHLFLQSWDTPWNVAKRLQFYFNTITEELIFEDLKAAFPRIQSCTSHTDKRTFYTTLAYHRYCRLLIETNSVDFAYILKCAYDLLNQADTLQRITKDIRYVLVDEYQDTNYIQEQILRLLASGCTPNNLIVIGDEDQALYRFRGATVRNILHFADTFPERMPERVSLTINYRSHPGIIATYNQWMGSFDWSNPAGPALRTEKTICANPILEHADYPSTVTITGADIHDEAEQFAELVATLKQEGKIADYSEVALLLNSVRYMGDPYIQALEKRDIRVYYPRARRFFQQEEILLMIGGFAHILQYSEGEYAPGREENFAQALDACLKRLLEQCSSHSALEEEFQIIAEEIQNAGDEDDLCLADYFYRLIFLPPFSDFFDRESKRANLVLFSGLLRTFQKYFAYKAITFANIEAIKIDFFDNFLAFLYIDGLNEEEDQHRPLLKGYVQILTIYQAKGLEFPVVVVGRLDDPPSSSTNRERRDLQRYYHHAQFEPESRVSGCDRRRLYYVAFSRAKDLLVLTAQRQPHANFAQIWNERPSFAYLNERFLTVPPFSNTRENRPPRPRYGFTTHFQTYRICPRRYHFFYGQRFVPSRTRDALFGQLVHQTIERLHRIALDRELDALDEPQLQKVFEKIYHFLQRTTKRSLSVAEQEQAFRHVLNYFQHNLHKLRNVYATEHPVQIAHNDYVLNGKIDVLIRDAEGLEILDFKTQARLAEDSPWFAVYQQQLYFYASALSKNQGDTPLRLSLYWTAEERLADALVEVPCHPDEIKQVEDAVYETITQIQQQQFAVKEPPGPAICNACDIRYLCQRERII
jgi:DNA helicase II / ATP-dependent DNA helicase PcrA